MSAKDDIERLEQKVDILYNVVWVLADFAGANDLAEHLLGDIMGAVNTPSLSDSELDQIGKSN